MLCTHKHAHLGPRVGTSHRHKGTRSHRPRDRPRRPHARLGVGQGQWADSPRNFCTWISGSTWGNQKQERLAGEATWPTPDLRRRMFVRSRGVSGVTKALPTWCLFHCVAADCGLSVVTNEFYPLKVTAHLTDIRSLSARHCLSGGTSVNTAGRDLWPPS